MSLGGDVRRLHKHLEKLGALSMEDNNQSIAELLRTSTRRRFKEGKDPVGKAWLPSKRVLEAKGTTLVDTARLRNSIRSRATAEVAEVGTNVIYAGRHQFGDRRPVTIRAKSAKGLRFQVGGRWITKKQVKVKIPARPYLGISEADQEGIKFVLKQAIEEAGKT